MSKFITSLLVLAAVLFMAPLISSAFAQDFGPGPAGIPVIEYMFSRVVCVTVPLGYTALLVVLVIVGIKYLTSAGEAKAVAAAHQTVTWGLLGILFLAIAWLILQLIQQFTGVEVTKFSLSSLPGVQGFTGSCWAEPPKSPTASSPVAQNPNTQNQSPAQIINIKNYHAHDSDQLMECREVLEQGMVARVCALRKVCRNDKDFLILDTFDASYDINYVRLEDIKELANVLSTPKTVVTTAGSIDNLTYHLKIEGSTALRNQAGIIKIAYSDNPEALTYLNYFIDQINVGILKFAKFKKGEIPIEHIRAKIEAAKVAIALAGIHNPAAENFLISQHLSVSGFGCDTVDYFIVIAYTPLIYLYPKQSTSISVKLDTQTSSSIHTAQGDWNVTALPDGTLTTLDGKKHKFIPYEFLRSDFKRPDKGFVVEGDKLEEYLRKDLWKKLGLTDSEINDYWIDVKPRIKPSPYYFVSLIDRSEIDRVLPMEVNPKPDTILRNMTYILPLSATPTLTPAPLDEEKLTAPKREGFTVLENGVLTDGF